MEEIIKIISDYGIVFVMMAGLVLLFAKYIPTLMNIWIERLKTKNANNDLVLEVVKNNTGALENNSRVIESNTVAMKNNSLHYDKMNNALDKLNQSLCEHDRRAEDIAKDIAIIKERKEK